MVSGKLTWIGHWRKDKVQSPRSEVRSLREKGDEDCDACQRRDRGAMADLEQFKQSVLILKQAIHSLDTSPA